MEIQKEEEEEEEERKSKRECAILTSISVAEEGAVAAAMTSSTL